MIIITISPIDSQFISSVVYFGIRGKFSSLVYLKIFCIYIYRNAHIHTHSMNQVDFF